TAARLRAGATGAGTASAESEVCMGSLSGLGRSAARQSDRGVTLLVVDDDLVMRRIIRVALEAVGHAVLEASRGDEALQPCQQHAGPTGPPLTDLVLPALSGPAGARRRGAGRSGAGVRRRRRWGSAPAGGCSRRSGRSRSPRR